MASTDIIKPALYLIPVPLGENPVEQVLPSYNHDIVISIRHFIVADIRSARRFLKKVDKSIDIDSLSFYELNEHTDLTKISHILAPLEKGNPMGIISEAGCPAVADPGAAAVSLAQKKNLAVIPLVGPSSILLSLMASGFNGQSFAFNGYLPVKPAERASKIRQLESRAYKEDQTQIFIEAPYRNAKMMESLISCCRSDTRICVAVGITTEQEYIKTKTVSQWKKEGIPEFQKIPAIFLLYK